MIIQIAYTSLRNPDHLKLNKNEITSTPSVSNPMFLRLIYQFLAVVTEKANLEKEFEGKDNKP